MGDYNEEMSGRNTQHLLDRLEQKEFFLPKLGKHKFFDVSTQHIEGT